MRVTNKMMTNNMINNITSNKNTMSKIEEQYSSGLKIQRPSDDPIIAARALKLRTNLSELNQYYQKNIPDALSWMDVSESALKVVNDIITSVHTYCVQGANDTLTETDRDKIVETLRQLKQQVYQEGDTNYAGRYVFTGYKTDTSLVFAKETNQYNYNLTEKLNGTNIDIVKKVINSCELSVYDADSPGDSAFDNKPSVVDAYRIRLAYGGLKDEGSIGISFPTLDEKGQYTYDDDGELITEPFNGTITSMNSTQAGVYEPDDDEVYFLEDTGELILGSEVYKEMKDLKSIHISYEKESFSKNDLRPEHYFDCKVTDLEDEDAEPVVYTKENQEINYEVNFNQKLKINTQGSDAIKHSFGRIIDEILNTVNEVTVVQEKIAETEKMLTDGNITSEQETALNEMLEILKTEYTLKTEIMQSAYERGITEMEKQQDMVNIAIADLGSRYVRLELTQSRLSIEQTDFEELLSTNEDADLVDTVIKYKSQETIYNASLSAAAKVVKNTLLDFL